MTRFSRLLMTFLLAGVFRSAGAQAPAPQSAPPHAAVRMGNHRGYGRIVYDFTAPVLFDLTTAPGKAELSVRDIASLPRPAHLPRNVRSVSQIGTTLTFTLMPGAHARAMRVGDRIVVDFLDGVPKAILRKPETLPAIAKRAPAQSQTDLNETVIPKVRQHPFDPVATIAQPAAGPQAQPVQPLVTKAPDMSTSASVTQPTPPAPVASTPPMAGSAQEERFSAPPAATAVAVSAESLRRPNQISAGSAPASMNADDGPISIAAVPLANGAGAILPFASSVGAAAFQRGSRAILVFDARQPLDLSQLQTNANLQAATVNLLPQATLVSFDLPSGTGLRLDRVADGWRVQVASGEKGKPIEVQQHANQVIFGLSHPSRVVVVPDPQSGAPLLVGTVRPESGPGAAIAVPRQCPAYNILPAWLGVVVEAASDGLQMRARLNSFALLVPPPLMAQLPSSTPDLANAAALTRIFDFPDLSTNALLRKMKGEIASAALSPPRARFLPRVAAAQVMIALGLNAEAYGTLEVARADDPRSARRSNAGALQSVAAMLNGNSGQDGGLESAFASASDESAFWRAVAEAARDERSPASAAVFAVTMPLVVSYPPALRSKLLPLVAETLVRGGQGAAADTLFARLPHDPSLKLAHAMRLQQIGHSAEALAGYDALAAGKDRLARIRAATRATEFRHHLGQLDAAATADALERLIAAWRGDPRELALRLRIAKLRTEAGQFRAALQMLRETKTRFPENAPTIQTQTGKVFAALLGGDRAKTVKPLELVAIAEDFADSVPGGKEGDHLAELLADRLMKLDLPGQAAPVLNRLMQNASAGTPRARFGVRLANVRLENGDAKGALAALRDSDGSDLSPALVEERTLVLARADAKVGQLTDAVAALSSMNTVQADDLRASLLEGAKDWPGALSALRDLAAKRVPATGQLAPDQQEIVLREASAALQVGDQEVLDALRQTDKARMSAGARTDLFHLLTGRPVQAAADLPRGARTVALAREMAQQIQALGVP